MSRRHASISKSDEELESASTEAARGAALGAAKWAAFGGIAAGVGQAFSPLYRGLTIQFKVFLQISLMTFGGVIQADRHLRQHEKRVRVEKRLARDAEVWRRYQEEYGSDDRS